MNTHPVPLMLIVWASSLAAAGVLAWGLVRFVEWRDGGRTTLFE